MTVEQSQMVVHQYTQENGRDKGMTTNSQKGVTWSENNDSNGMGKTDAPPHVNLTRKT